MRGFGQIDELARIAEPDVGVITNIGPVHLELVGSLEGVARAKAELLAHVPVAVVPADEPLLEPYLREDLDVVRFGTDVVLEDFDPPRGDGPRARAARRARGAVHGAPPAREPAGRGGRGAGRRRGAGGPRRRVSSARCAASTSRCRRASSVINDCYNANPLSMRAALDDLATQAPTGGGVSPCSETCSSWARARLEAHREIGAYAAVVRRRRAGRRRAAVGRRCPRRSAARRTWPPTRAEAASLVAAARAPRRRRAGQGVARDRAGDGRGGAGPWVRS